MNFFYKLTASIKAKLFFSFILISVIAAVIGFSTMIPLNRMEKSVRTLGHDNLQSLLRINAIKEAQSQIVAAERTLLIRQLADQAVRDENRKTIAFYRRVVKDASTDFEQFNLTPQQLSEWRAFQTAWAATEIKQNEFLGVLESGMEKFLKMGVRGGRQFEQSADKAFDLGFSENSELLRSRSNANQHLDKLVEMIQQNAIDAVDDSLLTVRQYMRRQLVFVVVFFIASAVLGLWLSGYITKPILKGVKYITRVADGNLSQNVDPGLLRQSGETGLLANAIQRLIESQRKEVSVFKSIANGDYTGMIEMRSNEDELGVAVGQMLNVTNETLAKVNVAVNQVTYGASAINNASQTLSQGAMETAASLEQISASISQIGEKTRANAESADEADKLAAASRASVNRGYEAVAEMIAAMKDLQTTSAQIAAVVKLIDNIAFQTNLLALNAAVEAARAGRHGRGFSIVADEVRSLAGRSAKAAKDTALMLEKTVEKLEKGSTLAEYTDDALREIVDNAARLANLFREIAQSSNEQSHGIGQIANGLSQIDRVTQHNTVSAGETASAAMALLRQAEGLRTQMERFRLRKDENDRNEPPQESRQPRSYLIDMPRLESPTHLQNVFTHPQRSLPMNDPEDGV